MRIYRLVSTAVGGVLMATAGTTAFAGCGNGTVCVGNPTPVFQAPVAPVYVKCNVARPTRNCSPAMNVVPGPSYVPSPINAYSSEPYGNLRTIAYKNTPNVNIMRVHSRPNPVRLADRPVSFTGGCTPTSTQYCRTPQAQIPARPIAMPRRPAPIVAAPVHHYAPRPVAVQRLRTFTGSGYNPANFAPRTYGNNTFTPGIANIPTSIVDRSPITHIGGVPQARVNSVTTASTHHYAQQNVIGHHVSSSVIQQAPSTGGYWEKTSGPTIVGGMLATQVVCRRQAPRPAPVRVDVVHPVIGVPTPVPTPAPSVSCAQVQPVAANVPTRYGSRWTN